MGIRQKLKSLREERGESLQQVADGVGVSRTHIWELESGNKKLNPSFDLVRKLAEHFDVTIEYLMDIQSKMTKDDKALVLFNNIKKLDGRDQEVILGTVKAMMERKKKN